MKKVLVIFCLLVFALPCFATFGYYEGCNDNVKPYDDSEYQAYAQKLKEEYYARVSAGQCERNDETYYEYVSSPLYEYIMVHPVDYGDKPAKTAKSHPVLDKRQSHELFKLLAFLVGTFIMCL